MNGIDLLLAVAVLIIVVAMLAGYEGQYIVSGILAVLGTVVLLCTVTLEVSVPDRDDQQCSIKATDTGGYYPEVRDGMCYVLYSGGEVGYQL